jgi:hypothetical protein
MGIKKEPSRIKEIKQEGSKNKYVVDLYYQL